VLLDAGCERVVVVLGASADEAQALVPLDVAISTVVNDRWTTGMAGSLSVGLASATGDAALVLVVDMPDLPVSVVERIVAKDVVGTATAVLARTVYSGAPGHPVLIGRDHWGPVRAYLDGAGDRGAKAYLDAHGVLDVECGDLYDGHDVDVPTVVGD
jgi:CTP:molybdopterin cytidylyltransferase MocA